MKDEMNLVELEAHLVTLEGYAQKSLPDDIKEKLETEIAFWKKELEKIK
jgi:hypothetical protein